MKHPSGINDVLCAKQNPLGIMQGRLSPKKPEKLQSFPFKYWEEEFYRAAAFGFERIEWLVDSEDLSYNPLSWVKGPARIKTLVAETGIQVKSLCAHFLINGALTQPPEQHKTQTAVAALNRLMELAAAVGIELIIVPLMDAASIGTDVEKWRQLKENLTQAGLLSAPCALALETDLPAPSALALLDLLACERIGLCYDLGNATALNFDVASDFSALQPHVLEVHIKDRLKNGGGSRCLGLGDTPVRELVLQARAGGYGGAFILETPVEDDWEHCARSNMNFMRSMNNELL